MDFAIIGAGLSGAVLGQQLRLAGHSVTIFEKSRGAGGRMATRRTEGFTLDHGAPCFSVRSIEFHTFLAPYINKRIVVRWPGRFVRLSRDGEMLPENEARFIAAPAMNALCKALIEDTPLRTHIRVAPIREPHLLHDSEGNALGRFDWIVSTAPGPQTAALFSELMPIALEPGHMTGGFTTMLGFAEPRDSGWDIAQVNDPVVATMICDSAKPARMADGVTFVIHAQSDWSELRIDQTTAQMQPLLLDALQRITGIDAAAATCAATHRWRYAYANGSIAAGCIFAPNIGLAACGDWCIGGGVEAAFKSAAMLADKLLCGS